MRHSRAIGGLSLALQVACSSGAPSAPASTVVAPTTPATAARLSCAPLPAAPPPDLVITFAQETVPMTATPNLDVRASLSLTGLLDREPSPPFWALHSTERRGGEARVAGPELESLYAAFRAHDFDRLVTEPVARAGSPHYGGRWLMVRWGEHACEVGDTSTSGVAERDQPAFEELVRLTTERYEAALKRGAVRARP